MFKQVKSDAKNFLRLGTKLHQNDVIRTLVVLPRVTLSQ